MVQNNKNKNEDLIIPKLLKEINVNKNDLNLKYNEKKQIHNLFEYIHKNEFYNNHISDLQLLFYMIKFFLIGFIGNKEKNLHSLIYSYDPIILYKIVLGYKINGKNLNYIDSFFTIKDYFEEENMQKINSYPPYICDCGIWYSLGKDLPNKVKKCKCGLDIGGKNEILIDRPNHFAIYYNESHEEYIENGRLNKLYKKSKLNGILLSDFKKKYIDIIFAQNVEVQNQLSNNIEINNDNDFNTIFIELIFLSQMYIYKTIGLRSDEIISEETDFNLYEQIKKYYNNIDNFLSSKKIKLNYFMHYFFDSFSEFLHQEKFIYTKEKLKK